MQLQKGDNTNHFRAQSLFQSILMDLYGFPSVSLGIPEQLPRNCRDSTKPRIYLLSAIEKTLFIAYLSQTELNRIYHTNSWKNGQGG